TLRAVAACAEIDAERAGRLQLLRRQRAADRQRNEKCRQAGYAHHWVAPLRIEAAGVHVWKRSPRNERHTPSPAPANAVNTSTMCANGFTDQRAPSTQPNAPAAISASAQ